MSNIKMEEAVLSEINLTHKALDEGVDYLIDWISKQPHLPNVTDKVLLKAFIVGSKSIERAKERLDKYYTARTKYPGCFSNRDPKHIRWEAMPATALLPGITPDGAYVHMIKVVSTKEEVALYDFDESIKHYFMLLDRTLRTMPIVSGHYLVIDCQGLTLEGVTKSLTSFTLGAFNVYQGSLPLRLKNLIVFNASSIGEIMVNKIFRAFLNEKLKQRIIVHSQDHGILIKYFPPEMIPSNYGGTAPTLQQLLEKGKADLLSDRDWFLNEGIEKSDESKREKSAGESDQMKGTFRKLQID